MKIIFWIVVVYAVICVVAYFGNRRFMYFPDPARTACEGQTSRPSFISMATGPMQPIVHQKFIQSSRAALAFFTLITVATAAQAEPTEENNVADAIASYDHLVKLGAQRTKSSPMASLWALVRRCDWQRREQ